MSWLNKLTGFIILLVMGFSASSQTIAKGKLIDAFTKEPVKGATIHCQDAGCSHSCLSDAKGEFELHCQDCRELTVSYIGYISQQIKAGRDYQLVFMQPSNILMDAVVVTAGKGEKIKRSEAPVAISLISTKMLQETRPSSLDQVMNKVSGVNMVSLGNEQHQMSIRQPMTTKSLFLYLEDGIPVRTTGLFNHNALIEMNLAAIKNIEVIKGPSSSLYGSEAIGGVVNLISLAPTAVPQFKTSLQASDGGYKRGDLQAGFTKNKLGIAISGYYADKRNGRMEYSDFHKASFTTRVDYRFNQSTSLTNSFTRTHYKSNMPGGIDSTMFATRNFVNQQTFTYRKVNALRYRSTLSKSWNEDAKTSATVVFRNNSIEQNPAYRIKDDYRKSGGGWIGRKDLAHGEINESSFHSFALIGQHRQSFNWKNASVTTGLSADLSPSSYKAEYIRIHKDTIRRKYTGYEKKDSVLTHYETRLNNYAAFASFEFNPTEKIRVVASMRYDLFHYDFNNHLASSAFSGAADTAISFKRLSPKIGFTYNLNKQTGLYVNYSQGFVPPQVTELFTGVKIPDLSPSVFHNYEIGGWASVINNHLTMDASIYLLQGNNEVVNVKLEDGSFENRNTGKTEHRGIEFGLNASVAKQVSIRFSGAFSEHRFIDFEEKGNSFNGKEMNNAPRWLHNAEIWYRPAYLKGFRIGAEWQKVGSYFMDARNTLKYEGYQVIHLRAGYQWKSLELWLNVMNLTDQYYATMASKSSGNQSYQLGEPRTFQAGLAMDLSKIFNEK